MSAFGLPFRSDSPVAALRAGFLAVALCLCLPGQSAALLFESVPERMLPRGVRTALWVRDCGDPRLDKGRTCAKGQDGFSTGDGDQLWRILAARQFDEVWLASGGGVLLEGVKVGEALRRAQATVRVPTGFRCVSACTVAFLGGLFRYVDEGATYEVHAASGFLRGFTSRSAQALLEELRQGGAEAVAALDEFTEVEFRGAPAECDVRRDGGRVLGADCQLGARAYAGLLFWHAQLALSPLNRPPTDRGRLDRWLRAGPRGAAVGTVEQRRLDAARIRLEGAPAAQEILMRIERDAMTTAIAELREIQEELGPRAGSAIDMLEAMYVSRIVGTAPLSRETLLRMGYVTALVDSGVLQ